MDMKHRERVIITHYVGVIIVASGFIATILHGPYVGDHRPYFLVGTFLIALLIFILNKCKNCHGSIWADPNKRNRTIVAGPFIIITRCESCGSLDFLSPPPEEDTELLD